VVVSQAGLPCRFGRELAGGCVRRSISAAIAARLIHDRSARAAITGVRPLPGALDAPTGHRPVPAAVSPARESPPVLHLTPADTARGAGGAASDRGMSVRADTICHPAGSDHAALNLQGQGKQSSGGRRFLHAGLTSRDSHSRELYRVDGTV
jgi:hypothetical protein